MSESQQYTLHWRGRESGPYVLKAIKRKLAMGEISLDYEILVEGRWITLHEFFEGHHDVVVPEPQEHPEVRPPAEPLASASQPKLAPKSHRQRRIVLLMLLLLLPGVILLLWPRGKGIRFGSGGDKTAMVASRAVPQTKTAPHGVATRGSSAGVSQPADDSPGVSAPSPSTGPGSSASFTPRVDLGARQRINLLDGAELPKTPAAVADSSSADKNSALPKTDPSPRPDSGADQTAMDASGRDEQAGGGHKGDPNRQNASMPMSASPPPAGGLDHNATASGPDRTDTGSKPTSPMPSVKSSGDSDPTGDGDPADSQAPTTDKRDSKGNPSAKPADSKSSAASTPGPQASSGAAASPAGNSKSGPPGKPGQGAPNGDNKSPADSDGSSSSGGGEGNGDSKSSKDSSDKSPDQQSSGPASAAGSTDRTSSKTPGNNAPSSNSSNGGQGSTSAQQPAKSTPSGGGPAAEQGGPVSGSGSGGTAGGRGAVALAVRPAQSSGNAEGAEVPELPKNISAKTAGERPVIFLVDQSYSMRGEKGDAAYRELSNAVSRLDSKSSFYILFFHSSGYDPMPTLSPVRATPENVKSMLEWSANVRHVFGSRPANAVGRALGLNPKTVWLISDGKFPKAAITSITASNEITRAEINAVAIESRAGEENLRELATKNGGVYRYVPATR